MLCTDMSCQVQPYGRPRRPSPRHLPEPAPTRAVSWPPGKSAASPIVCPEPRAHLGHEDSRESQKRHWGAGSPHGCQRHPVFHPPAGNTVSLSPPVCAHQEGTPRPTWGMAPGNPQGMRLCSGWLELSGFGRPRQTDRCTHTHPSIHPTVSLGLCFKNKLFPRAGLEPSGFGLPDTDTDTFSLSGLCFRNCPCLLLAFQADTGGGQWARCQGCHFPLFPPCRPGFPLPASGGSLGWTEPGRLLGS